MCAQVKSKRGKWNAEQKRYQILHSKPIQRARANNLLREINHVSIRTANRVVGL